MSYSAGTATSPVDLLQQLVTWLVSIGWTQDASAADGSGWRAHLHKSGSYVNLRASMNEGVVDDQASAGYSICMYLGTGYSGGSAWNRQAGGPLQNGSGTKTVCVGMLLPSGSILNSYFFADSAGDNVVVVVEKTASLFVHLGWGALKKCGVWTGGAYFFGSMSGQFANTTTGTANQPGVTSSSSCPGVWLDWANSCPCLVRADVDAFTGKWVCICATSTAASGFTGKNGSSTVWSANPTGNNDAAIPNYGDIQSNLTSGIDGRTNLMPIFLFANRDAGQHSLLGQIPNVYASDGVGKGYSAASEYLVGSDTYKLFPNFAVLKV